jgi:acetyl-CoA carboxylase carboxyl transferase subunit alpha
MPAMNIEPLDFEKPIFEIQRQLEQLKRESSGQRLEVEPEIQEIERKLQKTKADIYSSLTPAQRVQISRHPQRPFMLDYVQHSFTDFLELHGDRHFGDDAAMPSGFARIGKHKVLVTGHQKGRNTKENLHRNFGSAHPEGYRKALRLMRLAEKFGLPVVSLIDTPGAFPGVGAEERNIAEAIAFNLREMSVLRTPIVSVVIGEGGSGGALGIGVADRVLMLENSYYSVISPEGCAAILWKDRKKAPEAAEALRISAADLKELGIVDEVIPEPLGGAHYDHFEAAARLKDAVNRHLDELVAVPLDRLVDLRYDRLRSYGRLQEAR